MLAQAPRVFKVKADPTRLCETARCTRLAPSPGPRKCPVCMAREAVMEKLDRLAALGDVALLGMAGDHIESLEVDAPMFRSRACRAIIDAGYEAAGRHLWAAEAVRQVRDPVIDRDDDDSFGPSPDDVERAERLAYLAGEM